MHILLCPVVLMVHHTCNVWQQQTASQSVQCRACRLFLYPHSFLFPWAVEHTVPGASVTNLNEPPRALAAYTIAWVRR